MQTRKIPSSNFPISCISAKWWKEEGEKQSVVGVCVFSSLPLVQMRGEEVICLNGSMVVRVSMSLFYSPLVTFFLDVSLSLYSLFLPFFHFKKMSKKEWELFVLTLSWIIIIGSRIWAGLLLKEWILILCHTKPSYYSHPHYSFI